MKVASYIRLRLFYLLEMLRISGDDGLMPMNGASQHRPLEHRTMISKKNNIECLDIALIKTNFGGGNRRAWQ